MRFPLAAVALCVSLPVCGIASVRLSSAATTPPPPSASSPSAPPPADSSEAAAKHAKLTECLKEAKAHKLVGAEKTGFIKDCTAKP